MTSSPSNPKPPSLYAHILGQQLAQLPQVIQQLHTELNTTPHTPHTQWSGYATIRRTTHGWGHWLGKLISHLFELPPAGEHIATTVTLTALPIRPAEHWHRQFGTHTFSTVQYAENGYLMEQLGAIHLQFVLSTTHASAHSQLHLNSNAVYVGTKKVKIRLPQWFSPEVAAYETHLANHQLKFNVEVNWRLLGQKPLVAYEGVLVRASKAVNQID